MSDTPHSGTLYITATPIGNLEDITLRALRVLKEEADIIAAEDTRHTRKLLDRYDIGKKLISYWGEKEKVKAEEVISALKEGLSVALVSDAGTPGISDPGGVVISRAIEEGIDVVPLPGPSAILPALSISGLSTRSFYFAGFPPVKKNERAKFYRELSLLSSTVVFYEAPHRLFDSLEALEEAFGSERKAVLVKELTKIHEQVLRGTLTEIIDQLVEATIAGEYVIVIEGFTKQETSIDEALEEVAVLLKKGLGRKEAVKTIAEQYGLKKKELYDRSLRQE